MSLSGCIVTYNNDESIIECIKSILDNTKEIDFKLYICDNNSTNDVVDLIKSNFSNVIIVQNHKNLGFGAAHNIVIDMVDTEYHAVINPDIILKMDTLSVLQQRLDKDETIGLITPKILNMDGTEQFLPKNAPSIRYVLISKFPGFKKYRRQYTMQNKEFVNPSRVKFCTGCFFVARTEFLHEIGGFDDNFYMYFEDADLSRRTLKYNKDIIFDPTCNAYHMWERANTKSLKGIKRFLASMCRYFNKWGWKF